MIAPAPALGRHCLVAPGQTAPVRWAAAERIVIDPADPAAGVRMAALAEARTGCVLEVSPAAEDDLVRPATPHL